MQYRLDVKTSRLDHDVESVLAGFIRKVVSTMKEDVYDRN